MAVTAKVFGKALDHLADGDIDWVADTIHLSLHTSTYTPDQDAHDFGDDLTNEVANGNGYTTGGAALANKTRTYDAGTNTLKLDADDVEWTPASFTARYGVLRKVRGGAETANELIAYIDFGEDVTASTAPFTVTWAAEGILTIDTP